ncbi:hypothetical protein [Pseudoalteromonas lipolytica]|uniref:hypothetical protein n=1 Tax=Pseudoalteromonas lipolytica TaxID=570156 RepID=UPI0030B5DB13
MAKSFDSTVQNIIKKIILLVFGSGVISNALYIYGLAYYEGYIERLGFEYIFFPIKWEDSILWAYYASRELGVSTVSFWAKLTAPMIILILITAYFIARLWMIINADSKTPKKKALNFKVAKWLYRKKIKYPRIFKLIYPPVKWLLIMEQSIWAFIASYFVLIVLFFVPLFIFIWVYFPILGVNYGESIGEKRYQQFQKALCSNESDYWNKCIEFINDVNDKSTIPKRVYGRVIVRNGNLIGILTDSGPITMTMPKSIYHKTEIKVESE